MSGSLIARPEHNKLVLADHDHDDFGKDKRNIRKFMKQKKRKIKKAKLLEKSQEFKRHIKVKENLKVLNKYVKHIRTQSSGMYYNRNSGLYDKFMGFSNKLYKDLVKSKTPKNSVFKGFNFKKLLAKNDFTSNPNLLAVNKNRTSRLEGINVDTSQSSSQGNFFLE